MFTQLHRNIRIRLYTSFLSRVIGSMIFPFMAIYYTELVGEVRAGIMIMIQIIVQFTASLFGGHLADTAGRKRMMFIGEVVKALAFLGMIIANSPFLVSVELTFLMMLLISLSSGFIFPAAEAMLIDVSTKETRAFMYSVNYWTINLSIMIGIMVGGWFYKNHFFGLLTALFFMALVTLIMTGSLITETLDRKKVEKEPGVQSLFKTYGKVFQDIPFLIFTLGGIAILALEFQRDKFIGVRLDREIVPQVINFLSLSFSLDGVKLLSLLSVENTLLIVLLTAPVSKWIKNKPSELLMYTGFTLFGFGFAILAFSKEPLMLAAAVFILTCGELLYVPTRQSQLADIVDNTRRGAYMACNGFVYQFGKLFGAFGLMAGARIGSYGMAVIYLLFAFLGIILTKAALGKHRRSNPLARIPVS